MQTTTLTFVVAVLLTPLIGVAPAAAADNHTPCSTFELLGGPHEIDSVDLGPVGKGLGDERITEEELFDADGTFAGVARLLHIVVDPIVDPDNVDTVTLGVNAFSLPEGTIYGQVMMDRDSDFYDNHLPTKGTMIAVVGGTGAFVRSRGQILVTFEPKTVTPTHLEFQLHCD